MLKNSDLRSCGRPDWSECADGKHIEVVDFKTGRVVDSNGDLIDTHVVQVQLYALMLEAAFPGAEVTPFIEQAERLEVPWGAEQRRQLGERVSKVTESLLSQQRVEAGTLARPGVHCCSCRLRAMCPAYLDGAPAWWKDEADPPRPLPLDVWGTVSRVQRTKSTMNVRLTDVAGRRVRVDGIICIEDSVAPGMGDPIWCFDLEASEDLSQHGGLIQPRNFHECPPGPRWRLARRLRIFP